MKPKVLVVGAGAIGCSLAHELDMRGAAVTVLDCASVAAGHSGSTFAWVNSNNKTPDTYARFDRRVTEGTAVSGKEVKHGTPSD